MLLAAALPRATDKSTSTYRYWVKSTITPHQRLEMDLTHIDRRNLIVPMCHVWLSY